MTTSVIYLTRVLYSTSPSKDIASSFSDVLTLVIDISTDTETGPGVLETALAYTTALRMADNAVLFKYTAKSVGMKHGVMPSFMAKPWGGVSLTICAF